MEIKIAICDDNEAFIRQTAASIKNYMAEGYDSYRLLAFTSGASLLRQIKKDFIPDLIFLDIDLNEKALGTSIGAKIKEMTPEVLLVYMSGYSCYYRELAQAEPFCFLSKPIESKDFNDALSSALKRLNYLKSEFIFSFKSNGTVYRTDLKNVMYFESRHRVINIHMRSGEMITFYEKLDNLEKQIEAIYPYFLRVGKSFYVNYHAITRFSRDTVKVDGMELKIGRNYKERFREKMTRLL